MRRLSLAAGHGQDQQVPPRSVGQGLSGVEQKLGSLRHRKASAPAPGRCCVASSWQTRREILKTKTFASAFALVAAGMLMSGTAHARDQIRIVGSSTVYPFTTTVAEQLGKTGGVKTPVVESTGTGGGMKLFCAG